MRKVMRKIYAAIDFGSNRIKVVLCEVIHHKFHVLACSSVPSVGIRRGKIVDLTMAAKSLGLALQEIEESSSFHITKALVSVPLEGATTKVFEGTSELLEPVKGEDIVSSLQDAVLGKINGMEEIVTNIPVLYKIDDQDKITNPKGRAGRCLSVKTAVTTIPKENMKAIYEVMRKVGVEVSDVAFDIDGDYYEGKNKAFDSEVGAVINIGADKTTVAIYNKGIRIKHFVFPLGSEHVDKDIATIYRLDLGEARRLKENFAVASSSYADSKEIISTETVEKESICIPQDEISQVAEARLRQILKLSKKNINLLTNREIRYIIVTGGISEMTGFPYLVEEILGKDALSLSMTTMGVRHNQYSSVLGMLRYFDHKLSIRDIEYSMFPENVLETSIKPSLTGDSVLESTFRRILGRQGGKI